MNPAIKDKAEEQESDLLDLGKRLNVAMHPISSSAETSPTGSGQHKPAVSDTERPDIIMSDAGTENFNDTLKSMKRQTPGKKLKKVSEALRLLKKPEGRKASEPKHSTPEKFYASDILKIQQIDAFDYGSDQEISTA